MQHQPKLKKLVMPETVPYIIELLGINHKCIPDLVSNMLDAEDEREFDYAEGSKKGPKRWGKLKKEWAACSNGDFHAPIDMSNERVRLISKPERPIYKPTNATIKNRGHDISVSDSYISHLFFTCLLISSQPCAEQRPQSIHMKMQLLPFQQSASFTTKSRVIRLLRCEL